MDKIVLKRNRVSDCKIEYEYEVSDNLKRYFTKEKFYVEYSDSIKNINNSIAVIPALGTLLPISWIFDAEIVVEEIDEMFYNAIPEFKKGYVEMYPNICFDGKLTVGRIVKNENGGDNCATMFSGGVDAFDTLIAHIKEKPDLITIWGADIADDNETGWNVIKRHRDSVLKEWGLNGVIIKSSFRRIINEAMLTQYIIKFVNENWWHGFHHGIGMFALVAPIAFCSGYLHIYVASSFTESSKGMYTCASDPTIDNYVKFCGCQIKHDGYEFSRQDKIRRICKYSRENGQKIELRVCWESSDGSNCCKCEKCIRTMLGIYAEKESPYQFGFNSVKNDSKGLKKLMGTDQFKLTRYACIQKRIRENYLKNEVHPLLEEFYKKDISQLIRKYGRRRKTKQIIARILHKLRICIFRGIRK